MRKKITKYLLLTLTALIVIGTTAFYIWSQQTYKASKELERLVVDFHKEGDWLLFEPEGKAAGGVIIYPGAKVESKAYSYIAQELSKEGYLVGIPEVRLNLPILENNKADQLINMKSKISNWYIGGHSLGGVSAASYTKEHLEKINGLFFLASYPTESTDFSKTELPILSIYAEKDGLTTISKVDSNKAFLSDNTELYLIDGGNHAQFGMYGEQKGDNAATILPKEQQDEVITVLNDWLDVQSYE